MQAQGAARMNIQGQGHSQGAPVTSQQQPGGNQQQITQDGQVDFGNFIFEDQNSNRKNARRR